MRVKQFLYFLILLLASVNIECQAFVKYVTANLNLRYGPSTTYSVITVIPFGTSVTIDEDCDCKWVPVEYKGHIGYISTKYLSSTPLSKPARDYRTKTNHKVSIANGHVRYYTNTYGNKVQ